MTNVVSIPAPPAPQPWDHAAVVAGALAVLRLTPEDDDADRVDAAAQTAEELLDKFVDAPEPLPTITPAMLTGAVDLTVEIYRRKDAPFGVLNAWAVDDIPIRIGSEILRGVRGIVGHTRQRWGVA